MFENKESILEQETTSEKHEQSTYQPNTISKTYEATQEQEQIANENEMLSFVGFENYFNNREYLVKKNDGFLKIIQGLLGYTITKNIPGEDLVALSKIIDKVFQQETGFKIQPNDNISLKNGILAIQRNGKNIFQRNLPIMPQSMQIIPESELPNILNSTANINPYIKNYSMTQESTSVHHVNIIGKDGKILPSRKLTTYEIISDQMDDVLLAGGLATALIVITTTGPAVILATTGIVIAKVGTALMVASIAKCLADGVYEYKKNGNISKGDIANIGINIGASILDNYTLKSGSKIIVGLGTLIDEGSLFLGSQGKDKINQKS